MSICPSNLVKLLYAILLFGLASASVSSSHYASSKSSAQPTGSNSFFSSNSTFVATSKASISSVGGNDVGDEVASKILAVFLAKPASVSVGIETLVSASGSSSIVALFPTTYPITGPIDPTLSLSTPLALSEQFSASVSKSYSHGAATASKTTTSLSFTTQAPGLTQAPAPFSISVTTNNTGNGSTITSPPPGFSTFTASNPLWTSDTSTEINGTLCPVFYVGHHEGIVLAGLGGKPDDPVRPGCSGLFKSFIGCGTWIKLPHLGIFRINSDGVPIPQGEPTDPVEPGDPGTDGNPDDPGDPDDHHNDPDDPDDPDDENDTAQPTVHTREKTDSKSGRHDSSMFLQSSPNTWASAGSSTFKSVVQTKSSARHSGTGTTAFTRSKQSTLNTALRSTLSRSSTASTTSATATSTTLNTALRSTLPRSSTASTASATATSTNYIICLEPDISASQLEDITNDVKAHTTSTYSISLGSRPNDTVICAKLNPSSSAQFNADSRVSAVLLDEKVVLSEQDPTASPAAGSDSSSAARFKLSKRLIEPAGPYSFQRNPFVPELNFISQPPGALLEQMADYKFPATAGQGVDVYVPDSGGDLTNREFFNTIGTKRWLRPPQGTWPGPGPWAPIDPTGHGTCLADKVAGYNWGVAKNANLIFLRLPFTDDDEIFNSGMLLVFAMMTTDIDARTADARRRQVPRKLPVVSISWGTKTGLTRQFKRLLLQAIRNLMSRGAVVVMASGPANAGSYDNVVDTWPALARESLDDIIVVGTVNNNGELTSAQGGPLVDVYAPGVSITCARGPGNGYTLFSGTSVATPQVAGLAAIFLAAFNVQTAQEVKGLIINQAHSRNGGPDAIYIGNSGDFCRTRQKRDSRWDRRTDAEVSGVDVCQIELSSATTGILATPKSTVSSATPHISVHRSSVAKIPSSTTPDDTPPAKTSSTRAAVHSTSKGHCDDRTWYDTELECDNQCSPRTCTEVNDLYSNEFSAFVCEC